MTQQSRPTFQWVSIIPAVFVILWSTGFLGARYAMPYAEPFGFLSLRFFASIIFIGGYAWISRAHWPRGSALWSALGTGALIHAIYVGTMFWAIKNGFPAGFAGLIVGLQPVMTALLAGLILGEHVSLRQWLGLVVGLFGVVLVLGPRLEGVLGSETIINASACFIGVAAFSLGTVLQKRFGSNDNLAAGTTVQYCGALVVSAAMAFLFEPLVIEWTPSLIFALIWLVLVLSVGAIILLMILIRAGEMASVASLFYLVPGVTAIMAYCLFGESLNLMQITGIVITSAGVALATLRKSRPRPNIHA